jgi:hypothetical protein
MPRKIVQGTVGNTVLGKLFAVNNTLSSNDQNENLVINPPSGGDVHVNAHFQINAANEIRLANSGSTAYASLKADSGLSNNVNLTLPTTSGNDGDTLYVNASGALSFSTPQISSTDDNATGTDANYILFSNSTTAINSSSLKTGSSYLKYVPASGELKCRDLTASRNITATGDLQAATITETSSIAYKENVNPITNALDAIVNLQGVTYDRKDGSHYNEAGLIAEEVYNVIPNVVSLKDGKPEGINYTKLSAYLIEAVKTLTQEVTELKGKK